MLDFSMDWPQSLYSTSAIRITEHFNLSIQIITYIAAAQAVSYRILYIYKQSLERGNLIQNELQSP